MAQGDVTKVIIIGDDNGAEVVNVLHYVTTSSLGPKTNELDGLYDALTENLIYKQLTNDALDFMHETASIKSIKLRDIDDETIGRDYIIPSGDGNGKLAGDRKANILALLLRNKTEKIGRSFQGRNFWNFGAENQLNGDNITSGFQTSVLDWYSTMVTIINFNLTFSFALVVYSPTLGTAEPVTNIGIRGRMKHQERRAN